MSLVPQPARRVAHAVRWAGRALATGDFGYPIAAMQDGLDISAFERMAEQLAQTEDGRRLLDERPSLLVRQLDERGVREAPPGTLGRAVYEHLARVDLVADVPTPDCPFELSDEAQYAKHRWRQTHDFRHVVTGLSTDLHQEITLQAFQLGQIRNWMAMAQIAVGPLIAPWECRPNRIAPLFLRAFDAGRRAAPLFDVWWEEMLFESVADVRVRLHVTPIGPLW